MLKNLVEYVAKTLVEHPEQVRVDVKEEVTGITLRLHVAPADQGRVIGRQGRTVRAMRTVLYAAAARLRHHVVLQIVEDEAGIQNGWSAGAAAQERSRTPRASRSAAARVSLTHATL